MKISFQTTKDSKEFINFNNQSFPERASLNEKLIDFRYFNNLNKGDFIKNNVVAYDSDNEFIGQALYHPAKYYFKNKLHCMEWGFDLFVRPDMRKDSIGIHLLEFIKENKTTPIFASGVGEKALKIEKYFGYHIIGFLKKYYKLVNPFYIIFGFFQKKSIPANKFPKFINLKNKKFNKIDINNLWNTTSFYNKDLLEFERDIHFLKWRFYSVNFEYSLYKIDESDGVLSSLPLYFVLRTMKVKGITCLMLVDYRCNINIKNEFESILLAVEKIASLLFLPIVVTGSSIASVDLILETKKYKINGKDRTIICNKQEYREFKESIERREFIFSTFADSDGEYLFY